MPRWNPYKVQAIVSYMVKPGKLVRFVKSEGASSKSTDEILIGIPEVNRLHSEINDHVKVLIADPISEIEMEHIDMELFTQLEVEKHILVIDTGKRFAITNPRSSKNVPRRSNIILPPQPIIVPNSILNSRSRRKTQSYGYGGKWAKRKPEAFVVESEL